MPAGRREDMFDEGSRYFILRCAIAVVLCDLGVTLRGVFRAGRSLPEDLSLRHQRLLSVVLRPAGRDCVQAMTGTAQ